MCVTSVPAARGRHTGDAHILVGLGYRVRVGPGSVFSPWLQRRTPWVRLAHLGQVSSAEVYGIKEYTRCLHTKRTVSTESLVFVLVQFGAAMADAGPSRPCRSTGEGRVAYVWRRESSVAHPGHILGYVCILRIFIFVT